MRGSTSKSPIKLNATEIKFDIGDLFSNGGKPTRQKPHLVILRSLLPRIHYYHNKRLKVKES